MRQEEQLKDKYGTNPGFKIPDGYFEELNLKIMSSLPPYPEAPKEVVLSRWQRVKPYVYLAAMFAGVWMMMKVFHTVSTSGNLSLDNPPAAIVQAMSDLGDEGMPFYSIANEYALEEEVSENYNSIEEFQSDFGYELKPEYANIL